MVASTTETEVATPIEDESIVWSSILDHKYIVKVTRTAPDCGELTITDGATMLDLDP